MRRTMLVAVVAAFVPLLFATAAGADVKLAGGGHFQGSGKPFVEAFSKKTGIAASYTPGNTGNGGMKKRMDAGEKMDVVVLNSDDMADQVKAALIKPESVVNFGRDRMGLAVLKGAPKPDVSTPAKLRAALMAAKAVGMQEPDPAGHSGANLIAILTNLGLLDQVKKKAVIIKDASSALVDGKVDITFWSYPELLEQPKLDVAGPVPSELGGFTLQAIGIPTANQNDADAKAFIKFMTSADGAAVLADHGLESLTKK